MFDIKLYTRDGRYVVTVTIPPFQLMPEAIMWGERFFFRRDDGKYYEGMLWPIVPNAPAPFVEETE